MKAGTFLGYVKLAEADESHLAFSRSYRLCYQTYKMSETRIFWLWKCRSDIAENMFLKIHFKK